MEIPTSRHNISCDEAVFQKQTAYFELRLRYGIWAYLTDINKN
jgi:hypothetical protein